MSEDNLDIARNEAEEYPLLSRIDSPEDLRKLPLEDLPGVCDELRKMMIQTLSHNPGHFASSMGAVEIIVALHYVFDTPFDNLVWDVGHQAYAHKILTGRRDQFASIRTKSGISGFPSPLESEYDSFVAGHAGNSISAALGMAIADKSSKDRAERKTIAVIGDASISSGLAFEGLNNASNQRNDLLIVLNDNEMSIDNNVGALHRYLSELTTSEKYNRFRWKAYNFFKKRGYINEERKGRLLRLNNSLKAFISKQQNIFEGLNIRYLGPFDGHDVIKLVHKLREIKDMSGPRLLHLNTVKGKGFEVAERHPATWHAPGKFDPLTGERKGKSGQGESLPKWQDVFGKTLVRLAEADDRVVGITAAMPSGTSVSELMDKYPEKAYDVGISEGHAVTFAGGMAAMGKRPFVAIYSSFLQRAYDNIIHDVAIAGLPVVFCIDRAGLVGEDGVTHHGLFDLAYLRCIPGLVITAPGDPDTLENLMYTSLSLETPMAIRYPRGNVPYKPKEEGFQKLEVGKAEPIREVPNPDVTILSFGAIREEIEEALKSVNLGDPAVSAYDMIWLKPLDEALLREVAKKSKRIITVEDGSKIGGFGSAVSEFFTSEGIKVDLQILGVSDNWSHHGTLKELRSEAGIDSESILKAIRR